MTCDPPAVPPANTSAQNGIVPSCLFLIQLNQLVSPELAPD